MTDTTADMNRIRAEVAADAVHGTIAALKRHTARAIKGGTPKADVIAALRRTINEMEGQA